MAVADPPEPRLRAAGPGDAGAVARLHADSWRRHYRGAYSDAFLDGDDVAAYLLALWARRLAAPDRQACTIVADCDGVIVGLAHTVFGADASWGSLLDNLHVADGRKRQGIGRRLLALSGRAVAGWSPACGLYLWVLEQNAPARAFYEAQGGACVQRSEVPPPAGDPANLNGRPACLRYAWPHPPGASRSQGRRSGP
jgi:GNAT superfamily N-acetyltransferase